MSEQPKLSDSDKNVNIQMEKRDGETYVALGLFIIAIGIPVILGTYFAYVPSKTVDIVLSRGANVALPDFSQKSLKEVKKDLEDLGLTLGEVKEAFDASVPKGKVLKQMPLAGTAAGKEDKVEITLSQGPAYSVKIPRLGRQPIEIARKMVEHLELEVGTVTEEYNLNIPEGAVVRQEPAAAAAVMSGSMVNLVVSKGPEQISAPAVLALNQEEAVKIVKAEGLVMGPTLEAYNAEIPAGIVVSQSPTPGAPINRGAIIQLTVSLGPDATKKVASVPTVHGKSEAEAKGALEKQGLKVGAVTKIFDPGVPAGAVVSQNPPNGAYLESHSRAAVVNLVCSIALLIIGAVSIIYGRLLLARNKERD